MGMEEKNMFTKKGVRSKTHVLTSLVFPFYLFLNLSLLNPPMHWATIRRC